MAVGISTTATATCGVYYPHLIFPNSLANRFLPYSSHLHLRLRPLIPPPLRTFRFLAVTSGPPPPQPDSDPDPPSGVASKMSKLQDKVQIFLAVLFWMSLFFWASAWDGNNNNNNGRPDKGSGFRR